MGIDARHPLYAHREPDWEQLEDVYEGERRVKERGLKYLRATSGMILDGMAVNQIGWKQYDAYRSRATFLTSMRDAVEAMVGVMHQKPPTIELPAALEEMRWNASLDGESLETLLRKINEQQLITGRLGLLVDIPSGRGPTDTLPYISVYRARAVINWDQGPRTDGTRGVELVVLDESAEVRGQDFTWTTKERYRLLTTQSLTPPMNPDDPKPAPVYRQAVFDKDSVPSDEQLKVPQVAGRQLDVLPFVFVNTADLVPDPDIPPLLGLSNTVLSHYRGDADYRQALFMQGQDTLVVIGDEDQGGSGTPIAPASDTRGGGAVAKSYRVGAGAHIALPKGGDAKFIGVDSAGLGEMRQAQEALKEDAASQGIRLTDTGEGETVASGEALRVRVAAKTASLKQIALAGAEALEQALEIAAIWVGANPDEVSVTANTDFANSEMTPEQLAALWGAKITGAPISRETVHNRMRAKGLTELTLEEELEKIEEEGPAPGGAGLGEPGVMPRGQQPDQQQQQPPARRPGA